MLPLLLFISTSLLRERENMKSSRDQPLVTLVSASLSFSGCKSRHKAAAHPNFCECSVLVSWRALCRGSLRLVLGTTTLRSKTHRTARFGGLVLSAFGSCAIPTVKERQLTEPRPGNPLMFLIMSPANKIALASVNTLTPRGQNACLSRGRDRQECGPTTILIRRHNSR